MRFTTPAGINPIDRQKVVGHSHVRVEGALKTTGRAVYAAEHHAREQVGDGAAYGYIVGAGIAKGRVSHIDTAEAQSAPGVRVVVTHENVPPLGVGKFLVHRMLAAPEVDFYHQPVAIVVADTFEQARAAAGLIRVEYVRAPGKFDLAAQKGSAPVPKEETYGGPTEVLTGDFGGAFAEAPVQIDATYTTPDQSHAMMEPYATVARWDGDQLTCWTSIQHLNMGVRDLALILNIPPSSIRLHSEFIGGAFGGKGTVQIDLALAALAARVAKRPVKIALQRPLVFNGTTHRPATIQRIRLGAMRNGHLTAIAHEGWSGNLPGGNTEPTPTGTRLLYAAPNRLMRRHLAVLDLAEGNAMRAPGEASGMMALEVAMDELAEKLGMDPIELRIVNDTAVDPEKPSRPFSTRPFVTCLKTGAEMFSWKSRSAVAGKRREGRWLIGTGMASAIRGASVSKSAARVRLAANGTATVECDMTDLGTGSFTIIAQTAAEMLGLSIDQVTVKLADSTFPETPGSGGQKGAASATAGVFAACEKLRGMVALRLGLEPTDLVFADGQVLSDGEALPLKAAARDGELVAEDTIEYGDLSERYAQEAFGAHFAEVAVDAYTGQIRVRRMLAVCAAGRILNPLTARSQVIGGMTMGIGAALMEEMAIDKRFGAFINHDLAGYEVPVHADVPPLDVHFINELDPTMSPLKAKGVSELGISGVAPAIANAVYNATGVRVREYPITLDKHLERLPELA